MTDYIFILLMLLLSAFFSGSEIAFVSADKLRIELDKKNNLRVGKALSILYSRPEELVTTLLVGNNIVLVVYGLLMAKIMEPALRSFIDNDALIVLFQSILSTIVILFTGEFLPKQIFRENANLMMRIFAFPIALIYYLLIPISKLFTWLSRGIIFLIDRNPKPSVIYSLSREDLEQYLADNITEHTEDGASSMEVKIIQNALDFSNVQVRDCMIPRNEIIACDYKTDKEELKSMFINTGLSKVVVYKENIDDIIGYIHSSELFNGEKWQNRIKQTIFVPESMYANRLMRMLMQRKKSIAIVIDERGGTAGMVSLEDVVEEIFGDIEDEHDKRKLVAKQINENTYVLSGRMEIDDVNDRFGLDLPESDDYMTIAGFIIDNYQNIPRQGEILAIAPYTFHVLRSTSSKIELVRMEIEESSPQ